MAAWKTLATTKPQIKTLTNFDAKNFSLKIFFLQQELKKKKIAARYYFTVSIPVKCYRSAIFHTHSSTKECISYIAITVKSFFSSKHLS